MQMYYLLNDKWVPFFVLLKKKRNFNIKNNISDILYNVAYTSGIHIITIQSMLFRISCFMLHDYE